MSSLSQRSASTMLVSPVQTKSSFPVIHSSRWQQPELSIGNQLPSLDRFGVYKCWALKDKSPAAVLWKTISGPIITLLEDEYEHLDAKNSELRVEMVMIGRKATNAVPTVLFCSEAKITRQNAMYLVKKNGILACHPGVHTAESSRLPRRLAMEDEPDLSPLPLGVYSNGPIEGCGISILVSWSAAVPPKRATLGGFISVEDRIYGLTAAHAFHDTADTDHISEQDPEFSFYDIDPLIDDSDDEDDPFMTSKGSLSSGSTFSRDYDGSDSSEATVPFDLNIRQAQAGSSYLNPHTHRAAIPDMLGSLFMSTSPKDSLDWALVELEMSEPNKWGNLLLSSLPINRVKWDGRWIFPTSLRPGREGDVLVCLGPPDSTSEGIMSGVSSFSKVRGSKDFQELWQVSLPDGKFVDGNCGTWIIDSGTGDLLGLLVSGYHSSQIAYVIPADQIFRDIEGRLDRHASISSDRGRHILADYSTSRIPKATVPLQPVILPGQLESYSTQDERVHQWTAAQGKIYPPGRRVPHELAFSGISAGTSTGSSIFSTKSVLSTASSAYSALSPASTKPSLTNNIMSHKSHMVPSQPPVPLPIMPSNISITDTHHPPYFGHQSREGKEPAGATHPATVFPHSELSKLSRIGDLPPSQTEQYKTPSMLGWNDDAKLINLYHLVLDGQRQPYFALKSKSKITAETPERVNLDAGKYPRTLSAFPCQYPGCNLNEALSFYRAESLEHHYKIVHGAIDEKKLGTYLSTEYSEEPDWATREKSLPRPLSGLSKKRLAMMAKYAGRSIPPARKQTKQDSNEAAQRRPLPAQVQDVDEEGNIVEGGIVSRRSFEPVDKGASRGLDDSAGESRRPKQSQTSRRRLKAQNSRVFPDTVHPTSKGEKQEAQVHEADNLKSGIAKHTADDDHPIKTLGDPSGEA